MTQRQRRMVVGCGAITAALLIMTACSSSGSSSVSSTSQSSTGSSAASSGGGSAAVAAAKADLANYESFDPKIPHSPLKLPVPSSKNVIMMSNGTPSAITMTNGLKQAAGILGWNLKVITYTPTPDGTQGAFDQAIAKKPDALFSVAAAPSFISKELAEIKKDKIPFFDAGNAYSSSADAPTTLLYGPNEDELVGRLMADEMIVASNADVHAAYLNVLALPTLGYDLVGIQDQLKKLCPSTCSVKSLDFQIQDYATGVLPGGVVSAIQRDPSINFLNFPGDFDTGMVSALKAAGYSDKVKIVGFAVGPAQLAEIKAGTEYAYVMQSDALVGFVWADTYLHYLQGDQIPAQATGQSKFPIIIPKVVVNSSNIGQIVVSDPALIPPSAVAQYTAWWGK